MLTHLLHALGLGKFRRLKKRIDANLIKVSIDKRVPASKLIITSFGDFLEYKWATLYQLLNKAFIEYGHPDKFPPINFSIELLPIYTGSFMSDDCFLIIRFVFPLNEDWEGIPVYDFFIDDEFSIKHHQPVF